MGFALILKDILFYLQLLNAVETSDSYFKMKSLSLL